MTVKLFRDYNNTLVNKIDQTQPKHLLKTNVGINLAEFHVGFFDSFIHMKLNFDKVLAKTLSNQPIHIYRALNYLEANNNKNNDCLSIIYN